MKEQETCRYCGKVLRVAHGIAYHPETGDRLPQNFYGGWVCSRECDVRACLRMMSSFPGAGVAKQLNRLERKQVNMNWPTTEELFGEQR